MELSTIFKIGQLNKSPLAVVASSDDGTKVDPYYIISETIDENKYIDITSNFSWSTIGLGHKDYQFVRNQIALRTSEIGFDYLPNIREKEIAAEFFVVSDDDRVKVYTYSQLEIFWKNYVNNMQKSRMKRWEAVKMLVSFYFSKPDSVNLLMQTKDLSYNYLTYGVESYYLDGIAGLFDYLEGTYSYSAETSFSSFTSWNETIHNKTINIIKYGIYE